MGAYGAIRVSISIALAGLALLVVPAVAQAAIFCVDDTPCVNAGGTDQTTVQAAINAAEANGVRDTIEIGPGTQFNGPSTSDNTNPIDMIGEGAGSTTLTRTVNTAGQTILTLADPTSTVTGLTVQLNPSSGGSLIGLSTAGTASNIAITDPSGAAFHSGVSLVGSGATLRDSSVSLPMVAGNNGVSGSPSGGTALNLERLEITSGVGVNAVGPIQANRLRISALTSGWISSGSGTVDHATVRLSNSGTALHQLAGTSGGANLILRHVTAVGPGGGTGASIVAGCDAGLILPFPAQGTLRNTILRGFENDLSRSGTTCGFAPPTPSSANFNVAYSIYDPAKVFESGSGSIVNGPGNQNVDPQFVDQAAGNLHLIQGSPAIDAGDPAAPGAGELTVDLDGNARTQDGNGDGTAVRDIGAFEHTFVAPPPPDGGGDGGGGSPPPPTELTRTLTLGYSGKSDKFKGRLRSNEPACLAGKVKVFEKQKGKDPKVGADKTNTAGKWSFEDRGADGKFYAAVPEKTVAAGVCPAARSKSKKVG